MTSWALSVSGTPHEVAFEIKRNKISFANAKRCIFVWNLREEKYFSIFYESISDMGVATKEKKCRTNILAVDHIFKVLATSQQVKICRKFLNETAMSWSGMTYTIFSNNFISLTGTRKVSSLKVSNRDTTVLHSEMVSYARKKWNFCKV